MHEIDGNLFDWDEYKHEANIRNHGVTFHEAATAIIEPNAISSFDFEHSRFEERYRVLGFSEKSRLLLVCHCYRNGEEVTRIFQPEKQQDKSITTIGGVKMNEDTKKTAISYDGEVIDVSDIPEVTDFRGWSRRNTDASNYIKDGKMRARVHFEDRIELHEFDAKTLEVVSKKVIEYKTGGTAQYKLDEVAV